MKVYVPFCQRYSLSLHEGVIKEKGNFVRSFMDVSPQSSMNYTFFMVVLCSKGEGWLVVK